MLARDIYRDLYEDSGPTVGEKFALAGKRLGIVLACGALGLGVLDFAGIHSIPGVSTLVQSARTRIAGDDTSARPAKAVPEAVVRVAVPKAAPKREGAAPSPIDAIAAAGRKDAVALAMNSPNLTVPASAGSAPLPLPAGSGAATVPVAASAATIPALSTPAVEAASPAGIRGQESAQRPVTRSGLALSDLAIKSQASVPPDGQVQLASLPVENSVQGPSEPIGAPVVATAPVAIPLKDVPLPRAAPPLSPADRLGLKGKDYARAERCLANAIYFEARSEPIRGQMAVAQVVINRVFSGFYPNDVCGVVYQNANRHLACQFTFACDGKSKVITERRHWAIASRIARQTLDGQIYVPEVGKSTHYHAAYVRPNWAREMRKLVRFGLHSFYRPYAWGNGNDEPVWGSAADIARLHKTASR